MWLWHGTYEMYHRDILNCGEIRAINSNRDTITMQLDSIINGYCGRNIRGNCVYLSNGIECMDAFDRSFRVSTKNLDTSKLYVANNAVLDYILAEIPNGTLLEKYIKDYIASYISFSQYIQIREQYDKEYNPEFLYYDNIQLKERK